MRQLEVKVHFQGIQKDSSTQRLNTPARVVCMKLLLNLVIYKESSVWWDQVTSFFNCSLTQAYWMDGNVETETQLLFFIHRHRRHVKKETWGRKLCAMIFSLGLLCWFVCPSGRHALSHYQDTILSTARGTNSLNSRVGTVLCLYDPLTFHRAPPSQRPYLSNTPNTCRSNDIPIILSCTC